jgi:hypothetical protein
MTKMMNAIELYKHFLAALFLYRELGRPGQLLEGREKAWEHAGLNSRLAVFLAHLNTHGIDLPLEVNMTLCTFARPNASDMLSSVCLKVIDQNVTSWRATHVAATTWCVVSWSRLYFLS